MNRRIFLGLLSALLLVFALPACTKEKKEDKPHKLQVVVTLYPLLDFTRRIAGDNVEVHLLLPPGMEAHSFEPKPEDILRINKADLFIITNRFMEPWAAGLLKGVSSDRLAVIDAGEGAKLLPVAEGDHREDEHGEAGRHQHEMDPHIWLSIPNAGKMVDNIAAGLIRKDPAHRETYAANAAAYKKQLEELDSRFKSGLSECASRMFMHGGHYAFGYLADRYGLTYMSAYAVSANAEPTPRKLAEIVKKIRQNKLHAIFYEELISPAMSEMIARETGVELIKLHGVHNVTRDEFDRKATYLSLMEQNLENLRKGLQCR